MAQPMRERRSAPWHRRLVGALLLLLPAAVVAGLFAPGAVRVAREEGAGSGVWLDPSADPGTEASVRTPVRQFAFQPQLTPQDFGIGLATHFYDLEEVFFGARHAGDAAGSYAKLLAFPRSRGDTIALGDVDPYAGRILFRDTLAVSVTEPSFGSDGYRPFELKHPIPSSDGLRFDDFLGPLDLPLPGFSSVPEPGTASLLGLGLAILAWRRRRAQRQPIGS